MRSRLITNLRVYCASIGEIQDACNQREERNEIQQKPNLPLSHDLKLRSVKGKKRLSMVAWGCTFAHIKLEQPTLLISKVSPKTNTDMWNFFPQES